MKATKEELVKIVASNTGLTIANCNTIITAFNDALVKVMADGRDVELRGLGSFKIIEKKAYEAINPKTLEKVKVPTHCRIRFIAGKALREAVR